MTKLLALLALLTFTAGTAAGPVVIWGSPYAKLQTKGIKLGGSDTSTTCVAALAGSIRYNAGTFEGCDGSSWNVLGGTGGPGTVTSVDMTVPSFLSVSGNPVTTSGTLAVTLATQTTNKVFAAPNGSTGVPTFRALAAADIPSLSYANQALSNLGSVAINADLLPALTTYNLGDDSGHDWQNLYLNDSIYSPSDANKILDAGNRALHDENNTTQLDFKTSLKLGAAGLTFPATDGSANQVLKTNGSGTLGWVTPGGLTVPLILNTPPVSVSTTLQVFGTTGASDGIAFFGSTAGSSNGGIIFKSAATYGEVQGSRSDFGNVATLKINNEGGDLYLGAASLLFPSADGSAGKFMQTNGSGTLGFAKATDVELTADFKYRAPSNAPQIYSGIGWLAESPETAEGASIKVERTAYAFAPMDILFYTTDNYPNTYERMRITSTGHMVFGTAIAAVSSCGTSPGGSFNDTLGRIVVGSGGIATSCTLTFSAAFLNAPVCLVQDESTSLLVKGSASTTALTITAATPFGAGDNLVYHCFSY